MFKVVSVLVVLHTLLNFGHSSTIPEHAVDAELESYEETNRNTILAERVSYNIKARFNVLDGESQLGTQFDQRRIRRNKQLASNEVVRRPDSEYQAFLGPDLILPDNWRSLYSPAGLKKLSPCSSKK